MYFARKSILILLTGLLMVACSGQQIASEPTQDVNAILTAGVGTFAAAVFQTQTAVAPPATATPTVTNTPTATVATPLPLASPTASATATQLVFVAPLVTFTAAITGTPPTPNPTTLASGCNNLLLLRDETVPAGTVFNPEEGFTKVWKVANSGSCDWVFFYHLVFVSGERMGGEPGRLGKVIEPGKWTQLSLNLQAPRNPGTYTGYWRFADNSGTAFGSTLSVSIEVKASSYP